MDAIYAPRPFSRTPRGYRSIGDGGVRSFGSLSALNNASDDEAAGGGGPAYHDLRHLGPQSRYSIANVNEPNLYHHRNDNHLAFRPIAGGHNRVTTETAGGPPAHPQPPFDQFSIDSNLSSRASSPMGRFPPPFAHHRSAVSPPVHRPVGYSEHVPTYQQVQMMRNGHYDAPGVSRGGFRSPAEEDFLSRLKQQKQQVQQPTYSRPDNYQIHRDAILVNGTLPRNGSIMHRSLHDSVFNEDHDPWEHRPNNNNYNNNSFTNFENDAVLDRAYNRALHKTRSDSHLINDLVLPHRSQPRRIPEPQRNFGFIQSMNRPQSIVIDQAPNRLANGNLLEQSVNNSENFSYAPLKHEPWSDRFSDSDYPSPNRSDFGSGSSRAFPERIIPIQIGSGDRVLKIDSEELMHYTPASHQVPSSPPQGSWSQSTPYGSPTTSYQQSPYQFPAPHFQPQQPSQAPPLPPQRTVFSPITANTFQPRHHQFGSYSSAPISHPPFAASTSSSAPSPPPPPPPPPPPQQSNEAFQPRIPTTQATFSLNQTPRFQEPPSHHPARTKTPTREHPLIPSSVHEEILNVIPNRAARQPPAIAQHIQPGQPRNIAPPPWNEQQEPVPCGPVGSRVFNGDSRGSVVQLGTVTELGYITNRGDNRGPIVEPPQMSASYPAPSNGTQKSYAVVSRPMSPQATIVQPVHPVQPTVQQVVVQPPQKLPPLVPNVRIPSEQPPIEQPALHTAIVTRPACSPTTSEERVTSPALMPPSPIGSVYDNATDEEQQRSPIHRNIPRMVSPPPPHGILVKKEDASAPVSKSQKKVVFQVDEDEEEALRKKPQLGWADLGLSIYDCCPCPPSTGKTGVGAAASAGGDGGEAPPHVREYDDAVEAALEAFVNHSQKIGGDCTQGATQFKEVFDLLRDFLWRAAGQPEPEQKAFTALLEPITSRMQALNAFRETKRNTPLFNHISAMAEAVQAVGWVTVKKTPAPFVKEMLEAAKFFTNRVRKDHKDSGPQHIEWVVSLEEVINSLQTFVRKTHTTGLVWNSAPGSAPTGGARSSAPAGGPPGPPPPPPPPPADFLSGPPAANKDKEGRDALFKELNQGEAITSKLKKVTSDMQTHKNPSLRTASTVPASAATGGAAPKAPAAAPVAKPPKLELENGKQWNVEYFKNDPSVVVNVGDKKQTVYIFKCEGCTIRVNGKCNSITLDQCKKTAIAFDAIVAQVETINCQSLQIQTLGEMPTVSIQKTDGCQIYLSEAAVGAEIVTSKSSEMNVLVPTGPDGDYVEHPVPEQFKTVYKNGKLETSVSDIC